MSDGQNCRTLLDQCALGNLSSSRFAPVALLVPFAAISDSLGSPSSPQRPSNWPRDKEISASESRRPATSGPNSATTKSTAQLTQVYLLTTGACPVPAALKPPRSAAKTQPSASTHLLHSGWPLTSVRKACACMDEKNGTESRRSIGDGTCPRCGHAVSQTGRGRPRVWCSQTCRRTAYEERRAVAAGAIGVEVVRQTIVGEHALSTCVDRTIASPVGCRRVLGALTELMIKGGLRSDPKWSGANSALASLIAAARPTARHRW